jgi:hypothetical protein
VDDIGLALSDDVISVSVLRLGKRTQPPEPKQELSWPERLVIYLPDREVWVTSTRSSTAGANESRVT